jgi:hypothetical protein
MGGPRVHNFAVLKVGVQHNLNIIEEVNICSIYIDHSYRNSQSFLNELLPRNLI